MKKRLFAFGCSFTSYAWPTWADLLGTEFDYFENWGLSGIGNRAIAERIAECHARHNFNKNDLVIVQWSSHLRNDWWHQYSLPERRAHWKTAGSIFNYINEPLYDRKWIETFFYEPAYVMHTFNHVALAQGLLESTGCNWYMTGMGDLRNLGADLNDGGHAGEDLLIRPEDRNVEKLVWKKIPELNIYEKLIWGRHQDRWLAPLTSVSNKYPELIFNFIATDNSGSTFKDTHPTTEHYALWIKQELQDKLELSNDAIEKFFSISDAIKSLHQKFNFNKRTFELMSAKCAGFPENTGLQWPPILQGF